MAVGWFRSLSLSTTTLLPGHVPAGGGQGAVLAPAVGTEFESVEAGRTFYYGYGEKLGFKARTGSNRRSAGGGALIMQRFLCWRGTYLIYRRSSFSRVGKQKRGPYKKRAHRLVQEKDRDATEVIEVEGSTEKVAAAGEEHGQVVQSGSLVKAVMSLEKDARPKPISWAGLATASMARVKDGGKMNPAANTSQSQLLRALGVRVYRYTEEERRDIILKYLMKRANRAGIKRPTKVPSRQALAGKHRRGIGGQFLSTDELHEQMSHTMSVPDLASNKSEQLIRVRQEEITEMVSHAPTDDALNAG
ncbi:unnamed protein product [Musa textilis]